MAKLYLLDANAVLRFLLQDIEEQFKEVEAFIREEKCYVTLEVMSEVCYVLEGVYQVTRNDTVKTLRKLNNDVTIVNADVFLCALEYYDNPPKLDFTDCLMLGYKKARDIEIVTFDKKLKSQLNQINN